MGRDDLAGWCCGVGVEGEVEEEGGLEDEGELLLLLIQVYGTNTGHAIHLSHLPY